MTSLSPPPNGPLQAPLEPERLLGWQWSRSLVGGIAGLLCAAALALHAVPVAAPYLLGDDFQLIASSWTWDAAVDHLFKNHNEHIFPLGRISTWVLVWVAGSAPRVPLLCALQGPLAVLLGMGLVYAFVRRETGHAFYGLVSMAIFGVTTQYTEAVSWFSASFGILALDTLLLGLLAAQAWSRTGRWPYLAACVLACAASPGWFATGILAGPLCGLYLLWPERTPPETAPAERFGRWSVWSAALAPILGTVGYLVVTVPRNLKQLIELEHYGAGTAREAIKPTVGLEYTARSLIDNLILGTLGVSGVHCDLSLVLILLGPLVVAAALWTWWAPHPRMVVLGIGLVLLSYFLIYSARAGWAYERVSSWGRYQLWSHLGLTLFVAGGLPRWRSWLLARPPLTSAVVLAVLLVGLLMAELPRSRGWPNPDARYQQQLFLRRVQEIDDRCRTHHIAAARAREVLPPEVIYQASEVTKVDLWEFLRGSDDPRPVEDDATVLQLLFGPE